jgi:hypothetical protein
MTKAKKPTIKADAVDGDKDGLVQDGTKFERPATKSVKEVKVEHPGWFAELAAAPTIPVEDEPEAVTRARYDV